MRVRSATEWTPGVQFRWWRERAALLATEAAALFYVKQQSVSGWETNDSLPRAALAPRIDEVYGLEPGMAAAVIEGQQPPAELDEPRAVGIDKHGQLVWSARFTVDSAGRVVRRPLRAVR